MTSFHQGWKKNDRHLTNKNVNLVDQHNYFISFLIFYRASTWRWGKNSVFTSSSVQILFCFVCLSNSRFFTLISLKLKYSQNKARAYIALLLKNIFALYWTNFKMKFHLSIYFHWFITICLIHLCYFAFKVVIIGPFTYVCRP